MDYMFYAIVFGGFFSVIAIILAIRYLLSQRLEKLEEKARAEQEARKIAESNSGL